jgi:hypothetical protein
MMNYKQRYEFDCGVASARYRVGMLGQGSLRPYEQDLEIARCSSEDGTSHAGIIELARSYGYCAQIFVDRSVRDLPLFSIVNYQSEEDGHYGVLIDRSQYETDITTGDTEAYVSVWSPDDPVPVSFTIDAFDQRFYSKRYQPAKWAVLIS